MTYNITHHQENQGKFTKVILLVGLVLITALSWNTIRMFLQYKSRSETLAQVEREKKELVAKQQELQYRVKRAQTEAYIEQRARQFSLSKKGEYIVVAQYPSPSPTSIPIQKKELGIPPYQAWIHVFSQP